MILTVKTVRQIGTAGIAARLSRSPRHNDHLLDRHGRIKGNHRRGPLPVPYLLLEGKRKPFKETERMVLVIETALAGLDAPARASLIFASSDSNDSRLQ